MIFLTRTFRSTTIYIHIYIYEILQKIAARLSQSKYEALSVRLSMLPAPEDASHIARQEIRQCLRASIICQLANRSTAVPFNISRKRG